jgi:molybdopterin-guanine dinucleotide biosynthesis protein A
VEAAMRDDSRRRRIGAYILAGGRSRRMGRDKARLPVDGTPLACWLAGRLESCVGGVWLVAKRGSGLEDLGLPLIDDELPEPALVAGLHAALRAPGPEWRFVLACDMPAVGPALLDALWDAAAANAVGSAPRLPACADPEPLPSLWHRDVAARVAEDWGRTARHWVRRAGLAAWRVPEDRTPELVHCNTPEEWHSWLERRRGAAGTGPRPA